MNKYGEPSGVTAEIDGYYQFQISMDNQNNLIYSETASYTFNALLADIGGASGLFLGILLLDFLVVTNRLDVV